MEDDQTAKPCLLKRVLAVPEAKVLLAGLALMAAYLAAVGLTRVRSPVLFGKLLSMTGSHIIGGRAAGMSWGFAHELDRRLVILANMAIETFLVLIFYPLFVFSYSKLIVIEPLRDTMEHAQHVAEAHQKQIVKYGLPGLLLFVWFPFWMTGPLVGCIIGFLIGLPLWLNLSAVLAGTYLAIICWGMVLERVHEQLKELGPYVPFAFVALVLLLAISLRIRYAFAKSARRSQTESREAGSEGQ